MDIISLRSTKWSSLLNKKSLIDPALSNWVNSIKKTSKIKLFLKFKRHILFSEILNKLGFQYVFCFHCLCGYVLILAILYLDVFFLKTNILAGKNFVVLFFRIFRWYLKVNFSPAVTLCSGLLF